MGDSNEDEKRHASTPPLQGSTVSTIDSANIDMDNENVPGTPESENREIAPSGGNSQNNPSPSARRNSGILSAKAPSYFPISRSNQPPPDFDGESNRPGFVPPFGAHHFVPPDWRLYPHFFPLRPLRYQWSTNQELSLQPSTSLVGTATGRTRVMDPSVMRNMTSQATRPRGRSSHRRGASEPQSSLGQARQRRTPMNNPPIFPSVPTMTGSAAIPFTSQATVPTVRPPISTRARTASSAPSTSQTIPLSIRAATSRPPGPRGRTASSAPSTSQTIPPPFSEGLDETPGGNCCYCYQDLGNDIVCPILPCNHVYHEDCLNQVTPVGRCVGCEIGNRPQL